MAWPYRNTVLACTFLAYFTTVAARLVLSPLIPSMTAAFDVTTGTIGLALTGMWGAYALTQYPSGILGERFGERRVIVASVVLTTVGSAFLAFSPTFAVFATVALLLGAGAGLHAPVGAALLTDLFEDTGRALGFHSAAAQVAGLLAPIAAAFVGVRYGWRAGVLVGAAIGLMVIALVVTGIRPTPAARPDERLRTRLDPGAIFGMLARPSVAYTTVVGSIGMFSWQSFASFFPTLLVTYHGVGTQLASTVFGAVFLVSAPGLVVLGRLSDRVGRDPAIAGSLLAAAAAIAIFVASAGLPALVLGSLLMGLGMSWSGVLQSRYMDRFTADERGSGIGLARTAYFLVGATGNAVTGFLGGAAGWPAAFGLVVGLLLVAVALMGVNRVAGLGL
jgi:MFS family permease